MSVGPDLVFGLPHQNTGDACAAMRRRHVDLLDLVADDEDKACDHAVDEGNCHLVHSLRRAGSERGLGSGVDQLL